MRMRALMALFVLLGGLTACESRPPIDVYGHKDSTSKRLVFGIPL